VKTETFQLKCHSQPHVHILKHNTIVIFTNESVLRARTYRNKTDMLGWIKPSGGPRAKTCGVPNFPGRPSKQARLRTYTVTATLKNIYQT